MLFEETLTQFGGRVVIIVGDLMLDEFIWGEVRRISPEAPVPIVEARKQTFAPGGAANVAANVVSLGGKAFLGGLVGIDDGAPQLLRILEECGIQPTGLTPDSARPTTRKTRVIAHSQQIVRVDSEAHTPLSRRHQNLLREWLEDLLHRAGACVLSDYGKGVITRSFAQEVIALTKQYGIPVIVDPKGNDYAKYRGATIITPNLHELELATRTEVNSDASLTKATQKLAEVLPETILLITRGAQGMSLYVPDQEPIHIPTVARNVYDVTGAGDTVVSTLALALATGAEPITSAHLANIAAGIVVGKLGTARVTREELQHSLQGD